MYIVKILKRGDGASVVVAIVLAFVLSSALMVVTSDLAAYLSGIDGHSNQWRMNVVMPLISGALQLIVLEAFLRVVVFLRPHFVAKKK